MSRRWLREDAVLDGAPVDLPHSWNDRDTFQVGRSYRRGWGSYRRSFTLDGVLPPGRIVLRSEGFYGVGDLWLDGARIARFDGQYLGFSVEIAPPLLDGRGAHVLGIRLTNRCPRDVLPGIADPDFILHGGLAGRVWLESAPEVRLDDAGLSETYGDITAESAAMELRARVINDSGEARCVDVSWTLEDGRGVARGGPWSAPTTVPSEGAVEVRTECLLASPVLWSPHSPHLYTLRVRLGDRGVTRDERTRRIGLRKVEFRPYEGLFLNGCRVALRGCNRHESMPGFGNAMPEGMHRFDVDLMKRYGMNFVRLSHYPQHPAFLDACDERGLLVYAEIASWKSVRGGRWLQRAARQMRDMVTRDRHRPCILVWGMGNESRSRKAFGELRGIVRQLDPGRAVTYAENHLHRARRERTLDGSDVWSLNYELDAIRAGCEASRSHCVIVSECSNVPTAERGSASEEMEQVRVLERDLARAGGEPGVAGTAVWCLCDYATPRKGRYLRYSGVFDAWREPKRGAEWLRVKWAREPAVCLFADWEERPSGTEAPRDVHVFSNTFPVRVLRNGREVARVDSEASCSTLRMAFEPGELAAAVSRGGADASALVRSWKAPEQLRLTVEDGRVDGVCEPIVIGVEALDGDGHTALTWNGEVRMVVHGPATLRSYTADGIVAVRGGCGRVFVTRTEGTDPVLVSVNHDRLRSAVMRLEFGRLEGT